MPACVLPLFVMSSLPAADPQSGMGTAERRARRRHQQAQDDIVAAKKKQQPPCRYCFFVADEALLFAFARPAAAPAADAALTLGPAPPLLPAAAPAAAAAEAAEGCAAVKLARISSSLASSFSVASTALRLATARSSLALPPFRSRLTCAAVALAAISSAAAPEHAACAQWAAVSASIARISTRCDVARASDSISSSRLLHVVL